jgi:hypothetical protein
LKRTKTCVVLISHCDTKKKKDILLNTINEIKNHLDVDILLYSNKVRLSDIYQENINHYIFDNRNFDVKKMYRWDKTHGHKLITTFYDVGYFVIEQIKMSSNHLMGLGYEHTILMNYDIKLVEEDFQDINRYLFDNYEYDGLLFDRENANRLSPILLMFNIRKFYNYFNIDLNYFNKEKSFEEYLYKIFNGRDNVEIVYRYISSLVLVFDDNYIYRQDKFNLFLYNNKTINIFLYNISDDFVINLLHNNNIISKNIIKKETNLHKHGYWLCVDTGISIDEKISIKYGNNILFDNYNVLENILKKEE